MKKQIIRQGDVVRIINPEFFIRCGYPLCLKDGIKMIMEDKEGLKALDDGIAEVLEDKIKPSGTNASNSIFRDIFVSRSSVLTRTQKDFESIIKILAYYKIKKLKFGGNKRQIFTKRVEEAKGHDFEVLKKKMVVTGNYIPGSKGGSTPYGDYEAEPPCLDDSKSHMILYLNDGSVDGHFFYVNNAIRPVSTKWSMVQNDLWPLAIERDNIEVIKQWE